MGGEGKKGNGKYQQERNKGYQQQDGLDPFAKAHLKHKQQSMRKGRHGREETQPLLPRDDDAIPDAIAQAAKLKAKQEEERKYKNMANAQRRAEQRRFPKLARFLESDKFEIVVALMGLLQLVVVTVYTNCEAAKAVCDKNDPTCVCNTAYMGTAQIVFYASLAGFVLIWLCRLYLDKFQAFLKSMFLVDTTTTWVFGVLFSIVATMDDSLTWILSFNVLRIAQIVHVVRLLHKKPFFKETWLLIRGFASSVRTLVSSVILLMVTIFVFAVIGVGSIGHSNKVNFTDEAAFLRAEGFNSLFSAILMLFRFLFHDGSVDIVLELGRDLPFIYFYYGLFFTMTTFVVLNLIIGIIVDKSHEITSHDEEMNAANMIAEREKLMQQLADIFCLLDSDGSGTVTFEEFIQAFQIKEMRYMLQALDFDEKDLIDLFQTLDDDNAGCLNLEEFLFGMSRLHGEPRAKDFLALMKLAEACADLSKYLSLKLAFDKQGTGKSAKVAGERSRELCNRINTMRQQVIETQKIVEMMIHACKTIRSQKISDRGGSSANSKSSA